MVKNRVRGSITVFTALVIVMILALILSLVEAVHLCCVAKRSDMLIRDGAESVMAEYNRLLWKDYGILAVDMGYGNIGIDTDEAVSRSIPYMDGRRGVSFIGVDTDYAHIDGYRLLSDQDGMVLIKDAVIQETLELPAQLISDWSDLCTAGEAAMSSAEDIDELMEQGEEAEAQADAMWEESQKAAAEAAAAAASASSENGEETAPVEYTPQPRPGSDVENPVKEVKEWKKRSLLKQVLPDEIEVSGAGITDINKPSERGLDEGTMGETLSLSVTDRILYGAYLKNHFSNFTSDKNHSGAKYEWEYVLCGEDTDGENLEETVAMLLACRSAENLAAIYMDSSKMDEAEVLALAIVGWTGNDGVVNAVKYAIVAAWAYMESVLDVRLLLTGGRVPLLKSKEDWTSGLGNLGVCFDAHTKAKDCKVGFSYEEYLLLFSYLHPASQVGLRSLDVVENALHEHTEYAYCYVDQMVCEIDMSAEYSAAPIFASIFSIGTGTLNGYEFSRRKNITYLTPIFGQ